MGDPLKPARRDLGLEIWANGSWDALRRLRAQIAPLGTIVVPVDGRGRPDPAVPVPLAGADRGRYRLYLRILVSEES